MPLLDNPWVDLPDEPPFVLPQDEKHIERFNRKASAEQRVILDIPPEPYIGNFDAPVVLLNLHPDPNGQSWWNQRLRPLIEATSTEAVANRVLCVNYFPYHAKVFAHAKLALPSRRFALELVRSATSRRALIVVMRGYQYWSVEIRDLGAYQRVLRLHSEQNLTISRGNVQQGFDEIIAELNGQ